MELASISQKKKMELASLKVVFGMLLKNEDSQMPLFLKIIKCRYFNLVFFHWVVSQRSNSQLS